MNKKKQKKNLAKQRIEKLYEKAREKHQKNPELSNRYMEIAWKLKLKTRLKLPKKIEQRICRKCQSFLTPGKNQKIRINRSKITKKCLNCGYTKRIPLKNQKPKKPKD